MTMSGRRRAVMAALWCALFCQVLWLAPQSRLLAADTGDAQEGSAVLPPPPAPPLPALPSPGRAEGEPVGRGHKDAVVRIASDYALRTGDEIGDLVVVLGNAGVDGHVRGDLVVILGEARLGPTAVVDGDLAIVGGALKVSAGAVA